MKSKKLVVLLSVLVLATAPAVVAATGCDNNNTPSGTTQTDEYTFKFVGGDGATGTAPADIKKKADETFTLPANTFVKEGYDFVGWSDGTADEPYAAGATYKAGTSNVTFTAVWEEVVPPFEEGDYIDCMPDADGLSGTTVKFENGKVTITSVGEKYDSTVGDFVDVTNTTEYNYSVTGSVITFADTEDATDTYDGAIVAGTVIINAPVVQPYGLMNTQLVLSKTTISAIDDMGTNKYAQLPSFKDRIYMFDNGLVLACEGWGSVVVKYGTYTTVKNHQYSLSFEGDAKSYGLKITLMQGVAIYSLSDGYQGEYTLGATTVTFDGFGGWANGTYSVISDGTNTMVHLVDTEELTEKLYSLTDNTLTEITNAKAGKYTTTEQYPAIETILFNGTNLAGLIYSDEGGNKFVAAITVTENTHSTANIDDTNFTVLFMSNGVFQVKGQYSSGYTYYTLNGAELPVDPAPTSDLTAGDYVDSITSGIGTASTQVSAKIENTTEGTILTLTRGTSSAYYQVTGKDGTYTFTQIRLSSGTPVVATGYLVKVGTGADAVDVLFVSNIKAGSTSVVCALSSTAIARIDGVSAGYVNNPLSTSNKLYLFKNGFAVYYTAYSQAKCGTYTSSGDVYSVTYSDGTTGGYKVTLDEGSTKASYITQDAYANTYTIGGKSYVLDGWTNYTVDGESGKYVVGSAGFTIVNKDGSVTPYTVDGGVATEATDPIVGEVNGITVHSQTAPLTVTALRNKGLVFDEHIEVYVGTGCARVTYKVVTNPGAEDETVGEEQTVLVALGCTVEINGVTFTVTKVSDDGCANMSFKDGSTTRNVNYDYAAG